MPIILKDGRTVKNIVSRRSGEPKKVRKVTSFDVERFSGDVVDWNRPISQIEDLSDIGGWHIIENKGYEFYLTHDGTKLTWTKDKPMEDGQYQDRMVWTFTPNDDGDTYTMVSRDGYSPVTTPGTSPSSGSGIKVTNPEAGIDAGEKAKVKISNSTDPTHEGALRITDYKTVASGKHLNNSMGLGTFAIWWSDASGLLFHEVAHGEDMPVFHEKVWFKDYLSVEGTVTSAAYTPQIYVGSNNVSSTSPTGGQWVDCGLKDKEWEADIDGINPMTGVAYMFFRSSSNNNRYIDTITIPDGIDTSNCKSFNRMLASDRTSDTLTRIDCIGNLDTSNATTLRGMFYNCRALTSLPDLGGWATSKVADMGEMFYGCSNLSSLPDISGWNTSSVTDMGYMFSTCSKLTSLPDLSGWDTSNVKSLWQTFRGCSSLTSLPDISGWNVGNVTNMRAMLYDCRALTSLPDLSGWATSKVTDIQETFQNCTSLTTIEGLFAIGDGTKSVNTTNMLYNCPKLTTINKAGAIHNTVSFSPCPLTLDSAKVILHALSTPYSGSQALTFKQTTLELCAADAEATSLIFDAISRGWTIAGFTMPADVFRIGDGDIQDGLTVENFLTKETATSYEYGNHYYRITANEATSVDFSGRDVDGGIDLVNLYPMSHIDISDNPKLTDFAFNREEADLTFKPYGTAWWDAISKTKYIEDFDKDRIYGRAPSFGYNVKFYAGETFRAHVGDTYYQFTPTSTPDDSYVEFEYMSGSLEAVASMRNYTQDRVTVTELVLIDTGRTDGQWAESKKVPEAELVGTTYKSDSNWNKSSSFSKLYLKTVPVSEETAVDIYINSYGEAGYDYSIAFALDTDYTSTPVPSYTTTGVVNNTYQFSKDPTGKLTDNYRKVTYNLPGDGQEHSILVIYRKDGSGNSYDDRGYVFVPRDEVIG